MNKKFQFLLEEKLLRLKTKQFLLEEKLLRFTQQFLLKKHINIHNNI